MKFPLKRLFFSFLIICTVAVKAQNLVPNPSFEDTTACPIAPDNISDATDWFSSRNSPDYFNSCVSYYMGVPINFAGHQSAYDGNAYAGLATYSVNFPMVREFIGVQLTQSLVIGTKYFVSAFISRADTADSDCATNNFGFKFSSIKYDALAFNPAPINNYAHINSNTIITDKNNWQQVTGSFIADSAYQYLMMGNFYDDINTDTTQCADIGYYYVDMICLSSDSLLCNTSVGLNENKMTTEFFVYPNPSVSIVNIDFQKFVKPYDIIIYNSLGQEILSQQNISTSHSQIDLTEVGKGILVLKILHNNQSHHYKLLKQ